MYGIGGRNMKNKASVLTLRVPRALKERIEKIADREGVSINQLALYALTKEMQEIESSDFFRTYIKGKSKDEIKRDFDAVLAKIPKKRVPKWDKIE